MSEDWASLEDHVRPDGTFSPPIRPEGKGPHAKTQEYPCEACFGSVDRSRHRPGLRLKVGPVMSNLPALIIDDRDAIDRHFDEIFALMDRPKRLGPPIPRQPRRDTLASRRGKGMCPSPVGVAEFAGGEKIRMSFWQHAGKPWRSDEIRQWLCRIIGNERGRAGKSHDAAREDLRRKLEAARALMARPGSAGEGDAAKRAVKRLEKKAMAEAFDAMSVWTRVYPPATDLVSFHIEHNGKRVDLPTVVSLRAKRRIDVSKNYDVTIRWHTPADPTVRETVVKTWASSPKLADKIGLRGAKIDGTIPANAIIDAPATEPLRVVEPEPSPKPAGVATASAKDTTSEPDEASQTSPAQAAILAKLHREHGSAAVDAFFASMEEFLGSKRAATWNGHSRLWITVAKIETLKRKAG